MISLTGMYAGFCSKYALSRPRSGKKIVAVTLGGRNDIGGLVAGRVILVDKSNV